MRTPRCLTLADDRRLLASPASSNTYQNDGSVLHVIRAPGFVCIRAEGNYGAELAQKQLAESDEAVAEGPARFFIDWEALESYSSEARSTLTNCVRVTAASCKRFTSSPVFAS
ncbi:MAG: hypothetical protein GY822_23845 [Deltaproteobacteria bacterium]|nr:hypothetical protein [Deltaproteobacteria bacterium]